LVACAAGAFLALSVPIGSASAAMPQPASMVEPGGAGFVKADWNGRPDWHHHWRHEWRDHWRPEWHPYWHHHWHHGWDRPYGYQ
jgi:hypothetical protein